MSHRKKELEYYDTAKRKELLEILCLYVLEPEKYVKDGDIKETRPYNTRLTYKVKPFFKKKLSYVRNQFLKNISEGVLNIDRT